MTINHNLFSITFTVSIAVTFSVLVISVALTNVEHSKLRQTCIAKAIEAKMTGDDIQKVCRG